MTRKRFIKVLMGAGFQRNKAVTLAAAALRNNVSYEDAFFVLLNALSGTLKEMLPIIENTGGKENEP